MAQPCRVDDKNSLETERIVTVNRIIVAIAIKVVIACSEMRGVRLEEATKLGVVVAVAVVVHAEVSKPFAAREEEVVAIG